MLVLPADQILSQYVAFTNRMLQIVKVGKLDVCGRPLFTNLVTYFAVTTELWCNGWLPHHPHNTILYA